MHFKYFPKIHFVKKIMKIIYILAHSEESSLFLGDQKSWIWWVTLTHEFTSPEMFNKIMNCLGLTRNKPVTHESASL